MSKNKKWSSSAKFEIALQAIKGEVTINALCKKHKVSPSQVHAWKKQLQEQGSQIFSKSDKSEKKIAEQEKTQSILYEKIGQLTVERDYLKKCWEKFQGSSDDN